MPRSGRLICEWMLSYNTLSLENFEVKATDGAGFRSSARDAAEVRLVAVYAKVVLAGDCSSEGPPMLKLDGMPQKERKQSGVEREKVPKKALESITLGPLKKSPFYRQVMRALSKEEISSMCLTKNDNSKDSVLDGIGESCHILKMSNFH